MQVGERESAPGRAENAEPGDAVEGIEHGAGESERVENFRARGQLFKIDGAEGDAGLAEGQSDGSQGVAGAAENGDAVLGSRRVGLFDSFGMAADELHDLVDLGGFEVFALLDLVGIICCETFGLRLKLEMKLERLRA